MRILAFERASELDGARRVRRAVFERRSSMAISAACVIANGVRETLGALLAQPVALRLLEPVIPDAAGWETIASGAQVFAVRGSACDAAFVLRPAEALGLAACAFGESPDETRPLSAVEQEVLVRALRSLAGTLAPVCGRDLGALERISGVQGYATYFELLVERPHPARIGIALSIDPCSQGTATLRLEDLLDVEVELSVEFARGALAAAAFLDLRPGTDVPMTTRIGEAGRLRLGGAVLARGECGALGERSALLVATSGRGMSERE